MAYFNTKESRYYPIPVPSDPPYNPPPIPTPSEGSEPQIDRPIFTSETQIIFYINSSDNADANKQLSQVATFSGSFKNDVDIVNPVIEIETELDLTKCNYAYISMLGRYYYARLELHTGNIYNFVMHSDVLVNNREQLKNIEATIERQEIDNNEYIDDGTLKYETREFVRIANFAGGFNNTSEFILITAGG